MLWLSSWLPLRIPWGYKCEMSWQVPTRDQTTTVDKVQTFKAPRVTPKYSQVRSATLKLNG